AMALLTGQPPYATVTPGHPTLAFTLTRADFRNLLTQHPEVSLGLARILAERLEDATKQVGIEYVNLFKGKFDPRVVGLLPQSLCLLQDRKSTRLNSSHRTISYAVFCLKKKKKRITV